MLTYADIYADVCGRISQVCENSSLVHAALRVLECACDIENNRLYLVATGRLLGLVNLAEALLSSPLLGGIQSEQEECLLTSGLTESCIRVLGVCLSAPPRTAAQLQVLYMHAVAGAQHNCCEIPRYPTGYQDTRDLIGCLVNTTYADVC